jgi:hypothetical protein
MKILMMRNKVKHLRGRSKLTIEKARELGMEHGEIAIRETNDGFSELYVLSEDGESLVTFSSTSFNLSLVYPVGAIYISTVSTNPATLFGFGTWEQIEDRFLLAAGDTYSAGSTGGEASHKLTNTELPEINGEITMHHAAIGTNINDVTGCFTPDSVVQGHYRQGGTLIEANTKSVGKIKYTNGGANQPHNNMPPYLTVYMWKRVE